MRVLRSLPVTSGLQFWFKADALTGYADGATVLTWPDSSGNGRDATAVSGSGAIYHTNQINTLPALTFSSSQFTIGGTTIDASPDAHTIFATFRVTDLTRVNCLLGSNQSDKVGYLVNANSGALQTMADGFTMTSGFSHGTVAADTNWHQTSCAFAGVANSTYGFVSKYRADGAVDMSVTVTSSGSNIGAPTWIGAHNWGVTLSYTGQIAELIYYNRLLSDAEIAQVEPYLHGKYFVPPTTGTSAIKRLWPYQWPYPWVVAPSGVLTDESRLWIDALYKLVTSTGTGGGVQIGGDLGGTDTVPEVIGIQGRPVSSAAPTGGEVLTWVAADSKWEPAPAAGGSLPAWLAASPDVPPATPGSLDDEFLASSLDTTRWSWVNQGTATAAVGNSILSLYCPMISGNNKRLLVQNAPATPWEVTAKVLNSGPNISYNMGGLGLTDSTGKIIDLAAVVSTSNAPTPVMTVARYSSPTVFSSNVITVAGLAFGWIYYRIRDDGTNLTYSFSCTGSTGSYIVLVNESRTAFLTSGPTQVGLFADSSNPTLDSVLLCDWFRRTL